MSMKVILYSKDITELNVDMPGIKVYKANAIRNTTNNF